MNKEQLTKLKLSFNYLKCSTKKRVDRNGDPIEWLFTFDQWLKFWVDSGHLEQRGTRSGGYVMARRNDIGPYHPDNVDIILHSDNTRFAKSYWKMTDEQKKHLSIVNTGKTYSEEHCAKLSETHKKRWAKVDKTTTEFWTPSDEQRAAQSLRLKGKPRPRGLCPHCGIEGSDAHITRYHVPKCPQKPHAT